jgi:UDP-N-acetylglucosamine 2-epimerase (non-hydrolysing)
MKIITVFGTRPEAIKMAPVIQKLKSKFGDGVKVCVTAQHRQMLDQVLSIYNIKPDYDLNIMVSDQTLSDITCSAIKGLEKIFVNAKPDRVIVQGDTTTAFAAALSAFYQKIPVDHVEAGLRSHNIYAPWPEEMNRKITACLVDLHFAPTKLAAENLLREGINKEKIFITGNTIVDALLEIRSLLENNKEIKAKIANDFSYLDPNKKIILVTGHRRENFGQGIKNICQALAELSKKNDVQIIYPVHLNPNIQNIVHEYLKDYKNIYLIKPQDYLSFVYLIQMSYLILTDSGGVQEEAPTFGKPVLIMRNVTERPEAVVANISKIVGTNPDMIIRETTRLLEDKDLYTQMSVAKNPFGDGHAASRIVDTLMLLETNHHIK